MQPWQNWLLTLKHSFVDVENGISLFQCVFFPLLCKLKTSHFDLCFFFSVSHFLVISVLWSFIYWFLSIFLRKLNDLFIWKMFYTLICIIYCIFFTVCCFYFSFSLKKKNQSFYFLCSQLSSSFSSVFFPLRVQSLKHYHNYLFFKTD